MSHSCWGRNKGKEEVTNKQPEGKEKRYHHKKERTKVEIGQLNVHAGSRLFSDDVTRHWFIHPPHGRGVGLLDPVGQKSKEFVSRCPISACIPGDRDGVWHRSTSTKDGTLCPVSGSSALDHLHWSMDGMVEHEVGPWELVEGFSMVEMLVLWDWESTKWWSYPEEW